MTVDPGALIAAALLPIIGGAIAWGASQARLRALEKRCEELKGLDKQVNRLEATLEDVRRDQGRRIGDVEDRCAVLGGRLEGFEKGFAAGRRTRTAAHGLPVVGKAGE